MTSRRVLALAALALFAGLPACSGYRDSGGESSPSTYLEDDATRTVQEFRQQDPSLAKFFDSAHAWAVFPRVARGAVIVGAANGEGVVFQGGRVVGYSTVTQVTAGAAIGGQSFSQIIFFQDPASFANFKAGTTEFAANASAVAARSGVGASNDYNNGVAVFVIPRAGLMADASIGGQRFRFRPSF
jgi:hypothetical protein